MPSSTSGRLARKRRPRPAVWSPNIAGASRKNENTPKRNHRTQYSAPNTPGVDGGEKVAKLKPTSAAMVHDTAGWSPRPRSTAGGRTENCSAPLKTASAIPMAKKSTQLGGQMTATRSHEGWATRKYTRNNWPNRYRPPAISSIVRSCTVTDRRATSRTSRYPITGSIR